MKTHRRCKSSQMFKGELFLCKLPHGHFCAHFCENHWWPNKAGLPMYSRRTPELGAWLFLIVCAIIIAAFLCWLLSSCAVYPNELYVPHQRAKILHDDRGHVVVATQIDGTKWDLQE